jgi:hypothetical protein
MNVAANFAKFILYHSHVQSSVSAAGMLEFLYRNSTATRMLAADLLLIQLTAGAVQPRIALEAFERRNDV